MASTLFQTNIDFNSVGKVVNALDPTGAQDYATKAYVDANIEGVAWKDSVRVSTQGNISIAAPGATIDGITMATNDRFLVRLNTSQSENGIYIWNGAATPATRSLDASSFPELEAAVTTVEEGTNAGSSYRQTAVNGTLGSTNVVWTLFGTAAGAASESSAGIAEIATQAETDAGTDDARIVTPLKLKTASYMLRKFTAAFGDGAATSYAHNHNFNTKAVSVYVYETGGSFRQVLCEVQHTTVNQVTLVFNSAPASNALTVVIIG